MRVAIPVFERSLLHHLERGIASRIVHDTEHLVVSFVGSSPIYWSVGDSVGSLRSLRRSPPLERLWSPPASPTPD